MSLPPIDVDAPDALYTPSEGRPAIIMLSEVGGAMMLHISPADISGARHAAEIEAELAELAADIRRRDGDEPDAVRRVARGMFVVGKDRGRLQTFSGDGRKYMFRGTGERADARPGRIDAPAAGAADSLCCCWEIEIGSEIWLHHQSPSPFRMAYFVRAAASRPPPPAFRSSPIASATALRTAAVTSGPPQRCAASCSNADN